MADLYPEIEPTRSGLLDVGDDNSIYWETVGNPAGKPALVLHGGPGSGCTPTLRRFFDPARYQVVLFDQRGCGRSTPHAADPEVDLTTNTTWHLVDDIENLRRHLDIDQWLLFGVSWGSTLALAYAEAHPDRVTEIVLGAVTTTRPSEIDWLYHGAGWFLPEEWDRFRSGTKEASGDDLVAAYRSLLEHPDPTIRDEAARHWCEWEDAVVSAGRHIEPNPRYLDPRFRLAFARTVTHYFANGAWLDDGQLIAQADRLAGIPGVLAHGNLDFSSPLATAWELSRTWPDAELVVAEAGHSATDTSMRRALLAATDRFATD